MLLDGVAARVINVARPGGGVRIRTAAEPREEIELEMVVGVDQTGKKQVSAQVQLRSRVRARGEKEDFAPANLHGTGRGFGRVERDPSVGQDHGLLQTAVQIAGTRLAS